MVAKARTCERDTGERVEREIKRDRAPEREQDRRSRGRGRWREREKKIGDATGGGKQVGEKGRGSLGGPLLIAAGRGYVPRVIAAGVHEGAGAGWDPRTQPPRTLSRRPPCSRRGAARRVYALSIRALSFRVTDA